MPDKRELEISSISVKDRAILRHIVRTQWDGRYVYILIEDTGEGRYLELSEILDTGLRRYDVKKVNTETCACRLGLG
jgi:hypothetical protein